MQVWSSTSWTILAVPVVWCGVLIMIHGISKNLKKTKKKGWAAAAAPAAQLDRQMGLGLWK